ncbi:glycosyl transferase [Microbacterium sp. Gd 4-13]|uniref:glycosyltransferase n=1 Tax=Microbacterium sp. Gd 4-13 TaxID=2173179 RepID=UPI000D57FFE9|nr:glycosyltransferase [Microbacterium sp. Gd 4-13]PVW06101.1 glycosyl transferase [Microbacterium sp. Gd 4-13]
MTLEIFVPFWGDPALLRLTVGSVLAQRNPDWTLTVLDDQYPDDSVAGWFAELDDPRVLYLRNEKNLGITGNYREAVRRTSESHVTLLGCDDLLHPNYVDVVLRAIAQAPDADVIQPKVEVIDESGKVVHPLVDRVKQGLLTPKSGRGLTLLRGERMATSLIRGNWLYWPALTFRSETLKRTDFRDGLPIIQDLALLMDIAFDGGSLAYTPELAFSYRRHSGSASQKTLLNGQRFRDERAYYAQARAIARGKGWTRTARAAALRLLSRLHAVAELPAVIRRGTKAGIRSTLAHIFV